MNIVSLQPEHIEACHALYMAQTAHAPHCRLAPSLQQFRDELLQQGTRLRPRPRPQRSEVFVAEASSAVMGFATLTTYGDEDEDEAHRQAITGLFVADPSAAHALVVACERRATVEELRAFPSTHGNTLIQTYNVGWDGLSSHMRGVAPVLAQHGFRPYTGEIHLTAPLDPARLDARPLPAPLDMDGPKQSISFPWSMVTRAMDGEQRIGLCSFSTLAPITDHPEAREIGYIWGLGVDEPYQRRGIARTLLVAALRHLAAQGCRECWLTTSVDNWAAQPLYYSLGFEVVDSSYSFRKRLTDRDNSRSA